MQVRTPAVAGMFYPKEKNELKTAIHDCFLHPFGPGKIPPTSDNEKILGIISPHAGYMYSGPVATNSFYSISSQRPELVIITGPNHYGIGCNVAVMKEGIWKTPLGEVEVDSECAVEINKIFKDIELDFFSHTRDHSLEVQIPMLHRVFPLNKAHTLKANLVPQKIRYQPAPQYPRGMGVLTRGTSAVR